MTKNPVIVAVDDDEVTIKLLTKMLRDAGYQVFTAMTGQDGLKLVKDKKPDFIIMDILLPDRDGPEVIWALQGNPYLAKIPTIFLSSIIAKNENLNSSKIQVGEIFYEAIGKPVDREVLLGKIQSYLGRG